MRRLKIPIIFLLILAFYNVGIFALTSSKMEDGDFIKIVSVSTGKVLTVSGSDATEGHPVILSTWSGQPNQKFLAVEALVAGNSFLLMPQRQRYPWARFIRNGGTDPYRNRHDELPDWTMVLEANTQTGQVKQDARDGKLYQQWRAEKIESPTGGKKFLLKNRQTNECLQGPGQKSASSQSLTPTTTTAAPPTTTTAKPKGFFSNIWSSIRSAFGGSGDGTSTRTVRSSTSSSGGIQRSTSGDNVILAACDSTDVRQHWQLESLAYEYH